LNTDAEMIDLEQDLSNLILSEIKYFLKEIYQSKLEQIILFGSRARKEHNRESDFDILIILKDSFNYSEEIEKTSKIIADLSLKFDVVISRVFAKSEDFKSEKTPFFLNVRREGIIL
jgi:predicted nucleotidyltransferase